MPVIKPASIQSLNNGIAEALKRRFLGSDTSFYTSSKMPSGNWLPPIPTLSDAVADAVLHPPPMTLDQVKNSTAYASNSALPSAFVWAPPRFAAPPLSAAVRGAQLQHHLEKIRAQGSQIRPDIIDCSPPRSEAVVPPGGLVGPEGSASILGACAAGIAACGAGVVV